VFRFFHHAGTGPEPRCASPRRFPLIFRIFVVD
jgi:hypothetical protein